MDIITIFTQILEVITKLAPLSVIIAALGLVINFRQAGVKRIRDEMTETRETLNELGVKAYLLKWSLIGNHTITAGVLQIRKTIEARIGKTPSSEEVISFISDRLLFESVVEKAWKDSMIRERFQSEALEFGKIRAYLGNRIPLIQTAIVYIDQQLRMLFLVNTFIIFSLRNDSKYQELIQIKTPHSGIAVDVMAKLHRIILDFANVSKIDVFSDACQFLEEFSDLEVNDDDIINITRRQSRFELFKSWLAEKKASRQDKNEKNDLLQKLKDQAPSEFLLLSLVVDNLMRKKHDMRVTERVLEESSIRIIQTFQTNSSNALRKATKTFLDNHISHESKDLNNWISLLKIRSHGVDDPDIDLFLASATGVAKLVESSIGRGASTSCTLNEILTRYKLNDNA